MRGLSPHVRGNHRHGTVPTVPWRSIPACTGKPAGEVDSHRVSAVYPRMYGETSYGESQRALRAGLSPHVRGNRRSNTLLRDRRGSIPACTGKPPRSPPAGPAPGVYPRMYGETGLMFTALLFATGLSPHVRGNHYRCSGQGSGIGSIPACTGKPSSAPLQSRTTWVYPRMYGETSGATEPPSG